MATEELKKSIDEMNSSQLKLFIDRMTVAIEANDVLLKTINDTAEVLKNSSIETLNLLRSKLSEMEEVKSGE